MVNEGTLEKQRVCDLDKYIEKHHLCAVRNKNKPEKVRSSTIYYSFDSFLVQAGQLVVLQRNQKKNNKTNCLNNFSFTISKKVQHKRPNVEC